MRKPLVLICIPNMGDIRVELVQFLIKIQKDQRYNVRIYMPSGMLPLDNARNHCVLEFIKLSTHLDDRLWFIDADITPPISGLDILMQHDKGVVGLLCFMMKPDDSGQPVPLPVAVKYNEDKKYVVQFEGNGLTEIDAFGGGCVMIKRKVFEDIGTRPYEFLYHPDGTLKLVGDYNFCQKAQAVGYKIYVDYNNTCGHLKVSDLKAVSSLCVKIQNRSHV